VVPVVDLSRRGRSFADAFAERAREVASSGHFLLGPETAAFEAEFGTWCAGLARRPAPGASPTSVPHVVAVSSGASAIQLALAGLGVGPGDEVIVPSFTAVPTASAVAALGAIPVPVDVTPDGAGIDVTGIDGARTSRTRAVVVVHLYGRPAELPVTDLPVVEDAAQAHGAVRDHAASAAVAYSFYPTKNLGGIGDGGAVVTHDAELARRVRSLRVHGAEQQYLHERVSQNHRMAEIEAAWLRLALVELDAGNARRRTIAAHYREVAPHLRWHAPHEDHVYHLCVLRSADRPSVRARLAKQGIDTAVHYPLDLTQQPAYRHFARGRCLQSEAWAAECVTIPCTPDHTDDEVAAVAAALGGLVA
jgi:dTDP-3-amino-3,4,6-trideoxy-alpha-D-glucose transaminase